MFQKHAGENMIIVRAFETLLLNKEQLSAFIDSFSDVRTVASFA